MLTTKHLCLLSIAALSLAAVTPALAGPGSGAMLKGNSAATTDPGIALVAKRSGSPRAVADVNEKNRRGYQGVDTKNRRGIILQKNDRRRGKVPQKHKIP